MSSLAQISIMLMLVKKLVKPIQECEIKVFCKCIQIQARKKSLNPFVPNAAILYPLKESENLTIF